MQKVDEQSRLGYLTIYTIPGYQYGQMPFLPARRPFLTTEYRELAASRMAREGYFDLMYLSLCS